MEGVTSPGADTVMTSATSPKSNVAYQVGCTGAAVWILK